MQNNEIPRRAYLDKLTPAERLITDVIAIVEGLVCNPHLTSTVIKLVDAANHLADFVDGVPFVEPSLGEGK